MVFNLRHIPLFASIIFTIHAVDPITFLGGNSAESTISKISTTLSVLNDVTSAQFPYAKNVKDSKAISLAVVSLKNTKGSSDVLQDKFDVITQECSCYWLDVNDLVKRFPKLRSGTYRISMKGSDYEVQSGTFKLETKIVAGKTNSKASSKN